MHLFLAKLRGRLKSNFGTASFILSSKRLILSKFLLW